MAVQRAQLVFRGAIGNTGEGHVRAEGATLGLEAQRDARRFDIMVEQLEARVRGTASEGDAPPTAEPARAVAAGGGAGASAVASRPESAATARRLTQVVVLRQWGLTPKMTEDAVLLVSELVGNAVRHTGARVFGLRMRRRRGWIRVEVRDPSRGLPCLMPVQEMDISGRGLFLVDKLSDRWGVDLLPRGKTTWFEMRVADR